MSHPDRIQRSRRKGSRLPAGTVCVSRGTVYGNPFVGPDAVPLFKLYLRRRWAEIERGLVAAGGSEVAVALAMMNLQMGRQLLEQGRARLVGRDVACWCRTDRPCHGDALLRWANGTGVGT